MTLHEHLFGCRTCSAAVVTIASILVIGVAALASPKFTGQKSHLAEKAEFVSAAVGKGTVDGTFVKTVTYHAPAKAIVYNFQTNVYSGPMSVAEAQAEAAQFGAAAKVHLEGTLFYEEALEKLNPSAPRKEQAYHNEVFADFYKWAVAELEKANNDQKVLAQGK